MMAGTIFFHTYDLSLGKWVDIEIKEATNPYSIENKGGNKKASEEK